MTTSNQLLSPHTVGIATALVKNALLHASYEPKFSLRHKSNWIFSCILPNFEQNLSGRFLSKLPL
jgi:hypothetical protein